METIVYTPWGTSDSVEKIALGITFYGTPRHGGIKLSKGRTAQVPGYLLACSFGQLAYRGWWEEDEDANIPVLVFPDCFTSKSRAYAFGYFCSPFRSEALKSAVARFRLEHPDKWAQLRDSYNYFASHPELAMEERNGRQQSWMWLVESEHC